VIYSLCSPGLRGVTKRARNTPTPAHIHSHPRLSLVMSIKTAALPAYGDFLMAGDSHQFSFRA